MSKLVNKVNNLLEKFGIQKENQGKFFIVLLVISTGAIIIPKILHFLGLSVDFVLLVFMLTGLCLLMIATLSIAALAIFRSFFVVGAGFSLIIFLAQEYCKLDSSLRISSPAVGALVEIGMFYVTVLFIVSLYKELFGDKEGRTELKQKGIFKILREVNGGKHSLLILAPYTLFFGALLGQLVQVIFLIVSNLCIYTN